MNKILDPEWIKKVEETKDKLKDRLLPIGSVVLLKKTFTLTMIIGYCQIKNNSDKKEMYDYCGLLYPVGFIDLKKILLFNNSDIVVIQFIGYQNDEQVKFIKETEKQRKELLK